MTAMELDIMEKLVFSYGGWPYMVREPPRISSWLSELFATEDRASAR